MLWLMMGIRGLSLFFWKRSTSNHAAPGKLDEACCFDGCGGFGGLALAGSASEGSGGSSDPRVRTSRGSSGPASSASEGTGGSGDLRARGNRSCDEVYLKGS